MKKKKKNCKPNPLILTLVYRLNIYYSKLYQKGNWKKNNKKNNKQTQLSICKCGLGILDIDTQLNSLERKWNYRLVISTYALWKGLMLY